MNKQVWKPAALLAPVPATIVTCGTLEKPLALTVAWTGIVATRPATTYISIRPERNSYGVISESGEFAINLTTEKMAFATDFCGVRSGKDVDKFHKTKLTPIAASTVGCPIIAQSPVSLECRVTKCMPMGSHDMFLAEIVAVDVDEDVIDDSGKLCLEKSGLLIYTHGFYHVLGKQVGSFGWSVKKRKSKKPFKRLNSAK